MVTDDKCTKTQDELVFCGLMTQAVLLKVILMRPMDLPIIGPQPVFLVGGEDGAPISFCPFCGGSIVWP
jgi:hypothetical protein